MYLRLILISTHTAFEFIKYHLASRVDIQRLVSLLKYMTFVPVCNTLICCT